MKFNETDLNILRNLTTINQSLKFSEGDTIRSISNTKTILAKAKLSSDIPQTFAIYDLSRFLGVLSLFDDHPRFKFNSKSVKIEGDGKKVSYTFADPSIIMTPPEQDIPMSDDCISITMKDSQLNDLIKAMGILDLPHAALVGENGKIFFRAMNASNSSTDTYDVVLGETDKEFRCVFDKDNIKFMSLNYTIELSLEQQLAHFKSDLIEYWVPAESNL